MVVVRCLQRQPLAMDIILEFDPAVLVATGLDVDDDLLLLSLLSVAHLPTDVPRSNQGKPHRLIGVTLVSGNAPMRHVAANANHLIRLLATTAPFEKWRAGKPESWRREKENGSDPLLFHHHRSAPILTSNVLHGRDILGIGEDSLPVLDGARWRPPMWPWRDPRQSTPASRCLTHAHLPASAARRVLRLGLPTKFHGRRRLRRNASDVRMLTCSIFISQCTPLQTMRENAGLFPAELPPCNSSPCDDIGPLSL